jgi:hypothetical protein
LATGAASNEADRSDALFEGVTAGVFAGGASSVLVFGVELGVAAFAGFACASGCVAAVEGACDGK